MNKSMLTLSLLLSSMSVISAANILAIFTTASPSHHIWNTPLVLTLARKGHNVTVVSPDPLKKPMPNFTDIVIEGIYESVYADYDFENTLDLTEIEWIEGAYIYMSKCCLTTLKSEAVKRLLNYPSDTIFDMIIIEALGVECLLGILQKFGNPPVVAVNAFGAPLHVFEMTGTPNVPSYIPNSGLPFTDHMTLKERMKNFYIHLYNYYFYHYDYLPKMEKAGANYFGPQEQPVFKVLQNVSLVLANFHPTIDYPWANTPTLIPIGGIQIQDTKPLPTVLQKFLDEAKEGVIFFSLGSNVRSDKLTKEKQNAIIDAFKELPQRVLWKFESDIPGLPENVKIGKWLPQNDILAHPNVKIFITHAGLLSTHEAIYRGVPVIGIPFISDQHINIRRMVQRRCGVLLEYKTLTKESLLNAINEVITNSRYSQNMRELSLKFRDNPETALERAVFWIEYVLRHKGAKHLQTAAKNLNIIQYFLLDVISLLLVVPTVLILMLYCLCCQKKITTVKKHKQN